MAILSQAQEDERQAPREGDDETMMMIPPFFPCGELDILFWKVKKSQSVGSWTPISAIHSSPSFARPILLRPLCFFFSPSESSPFHSRVKCHLPKDHLQDDTKIAGSARQKATPKRRLIRHLRRVLGSDTAARKRLVPSRQRGLFFLVR